LQLLIMASASKFALKVTASGSYTTHEPVPVNSEKSITISTDAADIELVVRIKDFRRAHPFAAI